MRIKILRNLGYLNYVSLILIILSTYVFDIFRELIVLGMIIISMLFTRDILIAMKPDPRAKNFFVKIVANFLLFFLLLSLIYIWNTGKEYFLSIINIYWLIILYYIILSTWTYRIEDKMRSNIILRHLTDMRSINFHLTYDNTIKPMLFVASVLLYLFLYSVFTPFYKPYINYIQSSALILSIMMLFLVINSYLLGEIYWNVKSGIVELRSIDVPALPDYNDPRAITDYMEILITTGRPTDEFVALLNRHTYELSKLVTEIRYIQFVRYFILAMGSWRRNALHILDNYNIIMISVFKEFTTFGRIKMNLRMVFSNYLLSLKKMGVFPFIWNELIEYEIDRRNPSIIMNFTNNIVDNNWKDIYQLKVYSGAHGNKLLREKTELNSQKLPDTDQWGEDIWEILDEFIRYFIGPDAMRLYPNKLYILRKIEHLAKGELLESFDIESSKYNPDNVRSSPIPEIERSDISREEGIDRIKDYLDRNIIPSSNNEYSIKSSLINRINSINIKYVLIFFAILSINISILAITINYNRNIATLIFFMEIIGIVISGNSAADKSLFGRIGEFRKNNYKQLKIEYKSNFIVYLYMIILIIIYAKLFF